MSQSEPRVQSNGEYLPDAYAPTEPPSQPGGFQIHGNPAPLFAALAKAQGEFKPIARSKTVRVQSDRGSYTFDYAPLEVVLDATVPALSANELALVQPLGHEGPDLVLRTILMHSSGSWLETRMTLPQTAMNTDRETKQRYEVKLSAQQIGSAVTYMRRYMAQSLLGVNAEEDDDGSSGSDMQRTVEPRQQRTSPTPPKVEPKPAQQARPQPASKGPPPLPTQEPKPEPSKPSEAPSKADEMAGDFIVNGESVRESTRQAVLQAVAAAVPATTVGPAEPTTPEDQPVKKETLAYMRQLVAELGMHKLPKVNGEDAITAWCRGLLGKGPAEAKMESEYQILIADLLDRKAAKG